MKSDSDTIDLYETTDKLGDIVLYRHFYVDKKRSIEKTIGQFLPLRRYVEATIVFSGIYGYAYHRW